MLFLSKATLCFFYVSRHSPRRFSEISEEKKGHTTYIVHVCALHMLQQLDVSIKIVKVCTTAAKERSPSVLCDEGCHDEAFSRSLPEPRGSQEYRKSDEFRGNWRLWNDVVGRKSKQRTHGEEKMSSVETRV